jgi:hypothetical protein
MAKRTSRTASATIQVLAFSVAVVLAGLFFLVFAFQVEGIDASLPGDPGPEFLPAIMAAALIVGGLVVVWSQLRTVGGKGRGEASLGESEKARSNEFAMWCLVGGMLAYLPALSWIGFSFSTMLGCTALLCLLKTRWYVAAGFSIGLVLIVKAIFTTIFEVQLPEGLLENWLS